MFSHVKNCSCEKLLIFKVLLQFEDEILNATETLLNDKKLACAKSNCLIHTISLIVICLLLLVMFVICLLLFLLCKISVKTTISRNQL